MRVWIGTRAIMVTCGVALSVAAATSTTQGRGEVERTPFHPSLNIVLDSMTRLSQGIYYRDTEVGTGATARTGLEIAVSYVAMLADGTEIDRTGPGAKPLVFRVGEGKVIRGWDLGVRGMRVGGTRQLVVPSRYAYGAQRSGDVPPNSVMVFVMRLDGVR